MHKPFIAAAALASGVAAASAPDNLTAAFGAREAVSQISLSPDGTQVAVLSATPGGPGTTLLVGALGNAGELKPVLRSSGRPDRLNDCHWTSNVRIVCRLFFARNNGELLLGYSRYVTLKPDGSDYKMLNARTADRDIYTVQSGGAPIDWLADTAGDSILMTRSQAQQISTDSLVATAARSGLGVERVNPTTLRREIVEQPFPTAAEYITDGHGAVRIRGLLPNRSTDYAGDTITYQYRLSGAREWLPLSKYNFMAGSTGVGFNPYAVDRDLNAVYGFDLQDGRQALFRVSLDGSLKRELVVANPQVDIDELLRIGRQRRVVGVSFATEKRRIEFFDPELQRLGAGLSKALPNLPLVSFVDASEGEKQLLLWAGSDVDPGRYYLYDKASRHLGTVLDVRPQLAKVKLAPVKPITFKARDGTVVPGYLTVPVGSTARNLPAIVMPHGGPSARDEWGFDWLAQFFAAKGYAVLQPNFRGSAGYGDGWFKQNGFQSWRIAIGDVTDGGRWLASEGIADPAKIAIVGWSYGGYAALQSAATEPGLFKAVVAVAPVTDLASLKQDSLDFQSGVNVRTFIGSGPHVREGSPAQNVDRIKVPVLLFHGDLDQNVDISQSRLMASRLKGAGGKVELVEFHDLAHDLDDDTARATLLSRADAFLRAAMGM